MLRRFAAGRSPLVVLLLLAMAGGCRTQARSGGLAWGRSPRCVSCEVPRTPGTPCPAPGSGDSSAPLPLPHSPAPEDPFGSESDLDKEQDEAFAETEKKPNGKAKAPTSTPVPFDQLESEFAQSDDEPFGSTASEKEDDWAGEKNDAKNSGQRTAGEAPIASNADFPASQTLSDREAVELWPYHGTKHSSESGQSQVDEPADYPYAPAAAARIPVPVIDQSGWSTLPTTTRPDPAQRWMGDGRIQGLFALPVIQPRQMPARAQPGR